MPTNWNHTDKLNRIVFFNWKQNRLSAKNPKWNAKIKHSIWNMQRLSKCPKQPAGYIHICLQIHTRRIYCESLACNLVRMHRKCRVSDNNICLCVRESKSSTFCRDIPWINHTVDVYIDTQHTVDKYMHQYAGHKHIHGLHWVGPKRKETW